MSFKETGYLLARKALDQLSEVVREVSQIKRLLESREGKSPVLWNYACVDGIANGAIGAGTAGAYNTGYVTIMTPTASSLSKTVDKTFGTNGNGLVQVLNPCNASYTNGTEMVISWRNGQWIVITGSCNA